MHQSWAKYYRRSGLEREIWISPLAKEGHVKVHERTRLGLEEQFVEYEDRLEMRHWHDETICDIFAAQGLTLRKNVRITEGVDSHHLVFERAEPHAREKRSMLPVQK